MLFGRLDRYIATNIVRATGMTLVVLIVLLLFFNLVEELQQVSRGAYRTSDAILVASLTAPRYLFEVFPVAALLGSLLGLGRLAGRSELIAMRAAGFSVNQLAFAVLKVGLMMMLAVLLFSELVAPPAERFAQQWRAEKLTGQPTLVTPYGFWTRDGRAFINIGELGDGRHLESIRIYEFDDQDRLRLATSATGAVFEDGQWMLHDIRQSELASDRVLVRSLESAQWQSLLDPAVLVSVAVKPTMLPVWELADYIGFMRENEQSAIEYEVAFWLKVVNPLATLAMLFLAVPLVTGSSRGTSIGQRVFTGAILGAVFFLLTRALSYVAVVYEISPALMAFLPAALLLSVSILMLRRVK